MPISSPSSREAPNWIKGTLVGVAAWLVMMVVVMPMAGAGFFALNIGLMATIMTLVVHVIFGAVLGGTFGALVSRKSATT